VTFLKVSVTLQFPVSFMCTSPYCQFYWMYVCIYICWVTKVVCVKSDAVQIVCEQIMNRHDHVEFHRRKTLKFCRTVLLIIEVGFAQELNLYIYVCMCLCVCKTLF
jgi:hypothetical protein